jgi:LL-diaminopimelate aminotransferase
VGFAVGNDRVVNNLRTLKTNLDYGMFSVVQTAAATALQLPDVYIHEVQERYRKRRDFLVKGLTDLGWKVKNPQATFYLWAECPGGISSTEFALLLLDRTGVVVTPGNGFGTGGEGYVRISLIAECDRLAQVLERFAQSNLFDTSTPLLSGK